MGTRRKRPLSNLLCSLLLSTLATTGCHREISASAPALPATIKGQEYVITDYQTDLKAYNAAMNAPVDGPRARILRDKITYSLMTEIDAVYGEYTLKLYAGRGAESIGMDSLVLGLSSAATIATHAPTKTILSALGTAITGVGLSIDKNLFAQQTFQVIALAMQTKRDAARKVITDNLSSKDAAAYPLAAAKRDLIAYYYAGTLSGGLLELQQESGKASSLQAAAP